MKKLQIIVLFLSFFSFINAQNSNFHWFEKNGKIYYNKNLPVYFWISTTPNDNSGDVLMTSQRSKRFVNPMYFDTEGYNTFQTDYASDSTLRRDNHAVFKVYADSYPPDVYASFKGIRSYIGGKFIYKKGLRILLYAKDYISGTEKILYSMNKSDFVEYSQPIVFTNRGKFVFRFYAIDNTGNKSRVHTYRFSVK
jgi:hypothetical protein